MRRHFHRWYGAGPLHLVGLLASFALAWYAADLLLASNTLNYIIWIVGGAVVHDLVLLPIYSAVDRAIRARVGGRPQPTVPWVNHVRVPLFLSGLLFLVFSPLILGLPAGFEGTTGFSTDPYLGRWLAITGGLVVASALGYGARVLRAQRRPATE